MDSDLFELNLLESAKIYDYLLNEFRSRFDWLRLNDEEIDDNIKTEMSIVKKKKEAIISSLRSTTKNQICIMSGNASSILSRSYSCQVIVC